MPDIQTDRLVVSRRSAAEQLDCSEDTIDRLAARGELDLVRFSPRRVGITVRSLRKLIERGARS